MKIVLVFLFLGMLSCGPDQPEMWETHHFPPEVVDEATKYIHLIVEEGYNKTYVLNQALRAYGVPNEKTRKEQKSKW